MIRELKELFQFVKSSNKEMFYLIEILETSGSTYKKAGAKKIIEIGSGRSCGILTGGCLESEINRKALESDAQEFTFEIDTTKELDRLFGSGIGCDGKILLQYKQVDKKFLFEYFESKLSDQPKITIIGGGPDTDPLNELLHWSQWDHHFFTIRNDFFEEKVNKGWNISPYNSKEILNRLSTNQNNFVILMGHNYSQDLELLKDFYDADINTIQYLGLLGPKRRKDQLLKDLKSLHEIELSKNIMKKISAPVGINGLGKGESAVALSIMAEIQIRIIEQKESV